MKLILVALILFAFLNSGCTQVTICNGTPYTILKSKAQIVNSECNIVERTKIKSTALAVTLFPINLIPCTLANYIASLKPGNLWPIQYMLWPISGLAWGIQDAFYGYPFWEPSAIYD